MMVLFMKLCESVMCCPGSLCVFFVYRCRIKFMWTQNDDVYCGFLRWSYSVGHWSYWFYGQSTLRKVAAFMPNNNQNLYTNSTKKGIFCRNEINSIARIKGKPANAQFGFVLLYHIDAALFFLVYICTNSVRRELCPVKAQGHYWAGRTLPPNNLPPNMAADDLRWSEMPVPHYCGDCPV